MEKVVNKEKSYFYLDKTDNSIYRIRLKTLEEIYNDRDSDFSPRSDNSKVRNLYVPAMYSYFGNVITDISKQERIFTNGDRKSFINLDGWSYEPKDFIIEKIGKKLTKKDNIANYFNKSFLILLKDKDGNVVNSFHMVNQESALVFYKNFSKFSDEKLFIAFYDRFNNKDFFSNIKDKVEYFSQISNLAEKNYKLELYGIDDFKWLSLLVKYYKFSN